MKIPSLAEFAAKRHQDGIDQGLPDKPHLEDGYEINPFRTLEELSDAWKYQEYDKDSVAETFGSDTELQHMFMVARESIATIYGYIAGILVPALEKRGLVKGDQDGTGR